MVVVLVANVFEVCTQTEEADGTEARELEEKVEWKVSQLEKNLSSALESKQAIENRMNEEEASHVAQLTKLQQDFNQVWSVV